jgi:Zn-finger nucleic acid-binding protein
MKCPVCEDVSLAISSREGVEIDYCPQCRGVWLDRGELDKVIDRVNSSGLGREPEPVRAEPRPEPRYEERPRYDDRPKYDDRYDPRYDPRRKKKKRGFLEDLFEFD